jgi:hypothetical protein
MRSIAGERRAAHKAELILVTGNHYQVNSIQSQQNL